MLLRSRPPFIGALIASAAMLYAGSRRPDMAPSQSARLVVPRRQFSAGWGKILAHVWDEIGRNNISVMAAGVAFYGFLSIFPGMTVLISIYGLIADPAVIETQISGLVGVLPAEALKLVSDQLHALIQAPPAKLGFGLIVSLLLTMWSATSGAGTLMQALTVAFDEKDTRGVLGFYTRAFGLTIGMGVFGLLSLFLIAVVPAILDALPFPQIWRDAVALVRWPLLAGLVFIALGLLFRFAPCRETPRWRWFAAGNVAAALLWLVGSAGFSFYVAQFGSYNKTYGSLGAVVVLLMWFYVTAFIILAGAELNGALERR